MCSSDSDLSDLEMLFELSDWEESESDSTDEENVTFVRVYKERVNYIKTLNAHEFVLRFRVSKTLVESLLIEIYPHLNDTASKNIDMSPLHQLLLTLRYYALGSLIAVGQFIGVSKCLANQVVRDVSCAITHLYSKYICVNNTTEEFYKIAHFPHVLGVIDCTHIKIHITKGRRTTEEYKNNTGSYSINVQAVCDANLMFMDMESKWPGSTEDTTIFANSVLKGNTTTPARLRTCASYEYISYLSTNNTSYAYFVAEMQCERKVYGNKWLIGDNAYPLKPYLLTPILNPQSKSEELYNWSHNKTTDCIVQCFDLWKRRFPALRFIIRTSMISANAVILATAILHNICITNSVEDVPPEVKTPYEETEPVSEVIDVPKNAELEALLANHFNKEI